MGSTSVCQAGQILRENITGPEYEGEILTDRMNRRIKIINYKGTNLKSLTEKLGTLAGERDIGKIIFISPEQFREQAEQARYVLEGEIPGFFKGDKAFCYSLYPDLSRAESAFIDREDHIINEVTCGGSPDQEEKVIPPGYDLREVRDEDVEKLVSLYRQVFTSYPSPLFEPAYVRRVMKDNVYFLAVFKDKRLISAGSAEIDFANLNAEITDLATAEEARGMGLATVIISALEKSMQRRKLRCLYSLARAGIPGVNRVFYKMGYEYRGRMINNCHIGGRYEDMNLWVKSKA